MPGPVCFGQIPDLVLTSNSRFIGGIVTGCIIIPLARIKDAMKVFFSFIHFSVNSVIFIICTVQVNIARTRYKKSKNFTCLLE
jgi:hypothetical protein